MFFVLPLFDASKWQGLGPFIITMLIAGLVGNLIFFVQLLGAADAILQGSLFGLAGVFPSLYTQALEGGYLQFFVII